MTETQPSESRVVPLRLRQDLQVVEHPDGGRTVKDPVSLQYYRLTKQEFGVCEMLNGQTSFSQILKKQHAEYPSAGTNLAALNGFVLELLQAGLVTGPFSGLGQTIVSRHQASQRKQTITSFLNPLSFRLCLFDPHRLLNRGSKLIASACSTLALVLYVVIGMFAGLIALVNFETLTARLPAIESLLTPSHLLLCGVVFLFVKILHELSHAAVCHRFGGECHEMGILFIVFVPLFYCDVTDAWMLSSRWKRIAISLAGIGVETVIASIATLLWWFSVPGLLHDVCLSVMVVCTVNTLLLNGNPLLRYDGYHAVADAFDVPNLGATAASVAWGCFDRWALGLETPGQRFMSRRRTFMLCGYAIASGIYRVLVVSAISWCVLTVADQVGLKVVGCILIVPMLLSVVLSVSGTIFKRIGFVRMADRKLRPVVGLAIVAGMLALLLAVPFPDSITSPFVILPANAHAVHVPHDGRVIESLQAGESISAGQEIARLQNASIALQTQVAATEVKRLQAKVNHLQAIRSGNQTASLQLPIVEDSLAVATKRLTRSQQREEQLRIVSPVDGIILQAERKPDSDRWRVASSTILNPPMIGKQLKQSHLLCYVGNPKSQKAELLVDDSSIKFLQVGQSVQLYPGSDPAHPLLGHVNEISSVPSHSVPDEIVAARLVPPNDSPTRKQMYWKATVTIDANTSRTPLYLPGLARIDCGNRNLASRIAESLRRSFALGL